MDKTLHVVGDVDEHAETGDNVTHMTDNHRINDEACRRQLIPDRRSVECTQLGFHLRLTVSLDDALAPTGHPLAGVQCLIELEYTTHPHVGRRNCCLNAIQEIDPCSADIGANGGDDAAELRTTGVARLRFPQSWCHGMVRSDGRCGGSVSGTLRFA